jgi:hypothetical protein
MGVETMDDVDITPPVSDVDPSKILLPPSPVITSSVTVREGEYEGLSSSVGVNVDKTFIRESRIKYFGKK